MPVVINGTTGVNTDGQGNLTFSGTGQRIIGDFSNSTIANRVAFQTSAANSFSSVAVFPSGTATTCDFRAFNNSDPTNASSFIVGTANSGTEARLTSGIFGTGTFLPMTFFTGGSERVRIDTSGNVGIGTSTLTQAKVVIKQDTQNFTLDLLGQNASNVATLRFISTNYGSEQAALQSISGGGLITYTAGTERMRIDSSGNLLVGTTSLWTTARCQIDQAATGSVLLLRNNTVANNSSVIFCVKAGSTNNTSQVYVEFAYNSGANGNGAIAGNGDSQCTFVSRSDARLKENIECLSNQLDNVCKLRPVEFAYKDTGNRQIGFIAQEVQDVYPDLVSEGADGMLMLGGMDKTTARLVKAIQEQQAIIQSLTARIEALEAK